MLDGQSSILELNKLQRFAVLPFQRLDYMIIPPQVLIEAGPPNVILLRETQNDSIACDTFDYSDLNAYLLVVVGLANPDPDQLEEFNILAQKAREGVSIPVREVRTIVKKQPLVTLSESTDLSKAIESFASGVHRILVCKEGTADVVGVLSQLKLVRFLWDNGPCFPTIDQLYPMILRDLDIGTHQTIAIK